VSWETKHSQKTGEKKNDSNVPIAQDFMTSHHQKGYWDTTTEWGYPKAKTSTEDWKSWLKQPSRLRRWGNCGGLGREPLAGVQGQGLEPGLYGVQKFYDERKNSTHCHKGQ
jgi:hypothetical protein